VAAAVLHGVAGRAEAAVTYLCAGNAAVDQAQLQPLINAGGTITLQGPNACLGNFTAVGVSVSILGAASGVTMNGGGTGSVLLGSDATISLSNLTLTDGSGSGPDDSGDPPGAYGGGVSVTDSTLTVVGCRMVGNEADDQGGAIHAAESTVSVIDSMLAKNTSYYGGGAIDTDDDVNLTVTNSTVSGNTTGPRGAGIEAFDGSLTVTASTISANTLTDQSGFRSGGGIWAGFANVTVSHSTISGNSSTEFGGGIGYSGGAGETLSISDSTLAGNRAAVGGGIRNDAYYGDASLLVDHSTIASNTAGQGGGIDAYALNGNTSSVTLTASTVAGNRAPNGLGGGLDSYIDPSGGTTAITVASTRIGPRPNRLDDGNQANWGGGIAANGQNGTARITLQPGATIIANTARYDGGGIFTRNSTILTTSLGAVVLLNSPDQTS
jgi:hypothetical protein